MQAARALYANRTVASITIGDLVKEAGVAKATFYGHFGNLRALQAAVAHETSAFASAEIG